GQAHLRLHARDAAGDQQPLRRSAPRRLLEAAEGGRREDHRRGDQGHGGRLTMVRMSDLARGVPAEKAAPPKTAPPKEPAEKRAAPGAAAAPAAVPPALPRTRLAEGPLQSVAARPPRREPEPAPAHETPAPSPPATAAAVGAVAGGDGRRARSRDDGERVPVGRPRAAPGARDRVARAVWRAL